MLLRYRNKPLEGDVTLPKYIEHNTAFPIFFIIIFFYK